MPYTFHKSFLRRKSVSDIQLDVASDFQEMLCQLFITTNIIVLFYKETHDIFIYYKKSFHAQREHKIKIDKVMDCGKYIFNGVIREQPYEETYFKNMRAFTEHKLNYSRICKDPRYKKYIDYPIAIENLVEQLFDNA